MNSEIFSQRRDLLANQLSVGEAVVLFAKREAHLEKFTQENNFLYLTGLAVPNAIFVMVKGERSLVSQLFIQRGIPEEEVWTGKKMRPDEATEISGITKISYLDQFLGELSLYAPRIQKLYSSIGTLKLDQPLPYAMFALKPLTERYPGIVLTDIHDLIAPLRKVKSDWELMQLQRAIDITGKGIMDIMECAKAGMMEYELEATLFYRMQISGARTWGFAPIIASGINAATLHYEQNNCRIESGELVLLDVGASYMNYSADVTRCFPVSGSFSERQKQIYSLVLSVQKQIIEMIKPGITLMDLQIKTRELLAEGCLAIGLINDLDEITKYYMHGVSHFLGMDTHDVGGREATLEKGNVITVEPGIYIPEERLGVRIEDDVLVTETGYCVLSQNIPKEIEEIESIRKAALSD